MAQSDDDVRKIVRHFLDDLQKAHKVECAFLYGSYAKGAANEWSDIEIAEQGRWIETV